MTMSCDYGLRLKEGFSVLHGLLWLAFQMAKDPCIHYWSQDQDMN